MNMLVAFSVLAFVAATLAAPQGKSDAVVVNQSSQEHVGDGAYSYGYETSDGESKQESAQLKNAGTENEGISVQGFFTYVDPATQVKYTVKYIADENGFQPQGDHIPA